MYKRMYLHQFNQLGEKSVSEIAATLKLGGIDTIVVKTHQYVTYTGHYDLSPMHIGSLDDVVTRRQQFKDNGITMLGWCVPMGLDLNAEASFTANVAAKLGNRIELDLEPYPGFWDGDKSQLTNYIKKLQAYGVTVDIDFPPIPSGVTVWDMKGASQLANQVWAQSYWTDFNQSWQATMDQTLKYFSNFNIPIGKTGVIFPEDDPANIVNAAQYISARLEDKVGIWVMGAAGPAVYTAMRNILLTPIEPPIVVKGWQPYLDKVVTDPNIKTVLDDLWSLAEGARATDLGMCECIEASVIRIKSLLGL